MRSYFCLLVLFVLMGTVAPVWAETDNGETRVVLRNLTGTDLYKLHLAPGGTEKWTEDLLQGGCLAQGGEVKVTFPWGARAIWWDIHVETQKGEPVKWANVPMRRFRVLTLFSDDNGPRIRGE